MTEHTLEEAVAHHLLHARRRRQVSDGLDRRLEEYRSPDTGRPDECGATLTQGSGRRRDTKEEIK